VVSGFLNPSIDLLQGFKVHSEEVKNIHRENLTATGVVRWHCD
jgi:hypothetical protein